MHSAGRGIFDLLLGAVALGVRTGRRGGRRLAGVVGVLLLVLLGRRRRGSASSPRSLPLLDLTVLVVLSLGLLGLRLFRLGRFGLVRYLGGVGRLIVDLVLLFHRAVGVLGDLDGRLDVTRLRLIRLGVADVERNSQRLRLVRALGQPTTELLIPLLGGIDELRCGGRIRRLHGGRRLVLVGLAREQRRQALSGSGESLGDGRRMANHHFGRGEQLRAPFLVHARSGHDRLQHFLEHLDHGRRNTQQLQRKQHRHDGGVELDRGDVAVNGHLILRIVMVDDADLGVFDRVVHDDHGPADGVEQILRKVGDRIVLAVEPQVGSTFGQRNATATQVRTEDGLSPTETGEDTGAGRVGIVVEDAEHTRHVVTRCRQAIQRLGGHVPTERARVDDAGRGVRISLEQLLEEPARAALERRLGDLAGIPVLISQHRTVGELLPDTVVLPRVVERLAAVIGCAGDSEERQREQIDGIRVHDTVRRLSLDHGRRLVTSRLMVHDAARQQRGRDG